MAVFGYAIATLPKMGICQGYDLDDSRMPLARRMIEQWGISWGQSEKDVTTIERDPVLWHLTSIFTSIAVELDENPLNRERREAMEVCGVAIAERFGAPFFHVASKHVPEGTLSEVFPLKTDTVEAARLVYQKLTGHIQKPKYIDGSHRKITHDRFRV